MSAAVAEADVLPVSIIDAFSDRNLMGASFGGDTREAWRAILSGAFAVPMAGKRLALFKRLAGGRKPPSQRVRELWAIAGRRSDKSHTAGGIAVYLATIGAEQEGIVSRLSAGERGVILCLAVDRPQARVVLGYVRGLLADSPVLSGMVHRETAEGIELSNSVVIEVATNSHRSVRGRTLLAAILDEAAFFRSAESATPDVETYRALVPSLATTGGMLIGISSPYAKRGLLYDRYREHYAKDGDVLVVQGATLDFNPTLPRRIIDEADAADPAAARAEWHGEFRDDVETFVTRDTIDAVTRPSPMTLPFDRQHKYFAFVDPAGGGADEFCLAIGHEQGDDIIVDVLLARRGTPAEIVAEYAGVLREYCVSDATADRYAGSWPADEFARHGIRIATADKAKSDLYRDALSTLNSGRCELPPDDRLVAQFMCLERRTSRGGKDSIDHAPGGHDDRSNVVAGLIAHKQKRRRKAGVI